jgi:hypothetical protein
MLAERRAKTPDTVRGDVPHQPGRVVIRQDGTLAYPARLLVLAVVGAGLLLGIADPFTTLFYVSYVSVGVLLAFRRPRNTVSWLLVGIGFGFLGTTASPDVDLAALASGTAGIADKASVWIAAWVAPALFAGYGALTFVFPAGSLPSGRWRRIALGALVADGVTVVLSAVQPVVTISPNGGPEVGIPNPVGVLPDAPWWPIVGLAGFVVTLGVLAIALISLIARYRIADTQVRLQIRWLLAAMVLVLLGISAGLSIVAVHGNDLGGLAWIPVIFAYPAVPLAIGVAVLRYRLYEIDRIVNRAIVYGVVTAILAGAFAAATSLSQRLFITVTGESSDAATVLTTLVVVALYAPVRKRVEAVVDRRFKYDDRQYGPYLDELRRLLDLIEPQRAAARLAREALASSGAGAVAVAGPDGNIVATAGPWSGQVGATVDLRVTGSPIAAVLLAPRADGRPIEPVRLDTLRSVATVAATALGGESMEPDRPPAPEPSAPADPIADPEPEVGPATA